MRPVMLLLILINIHLLAACGRASGSDAQTGEPEPARTPRRGAPLNGGRSVSSTRGRQKENGLPERYEIIAGANLFRRLGWEETWHSPFGLVGIVQRPDGPRALITRPNEPCGLYVQVGANVGDDYTVTSIDGRSVRLTGGAIGEIELELDPSVVGARGGSLPSSEAAPQRQDETGDTRWYPVSGLSEKELILSILAHEGLTMEDMYSDPELAQKMGDKYEYLKPENAEHW